MDLIKLLKMRGTLDSLHLQIDTMIRQVTRKKFKSSAVVKHQMMFVVFETTSNVKRFLRAVLPHSTAL